MRNSNNHCWLCFNQSVTLLDCISYAHRIGTIAVIWYRFEQWRNSRGEGAGGTGVPPTLLTGKLMLTYREKRGKEKGEMEEEKKENRKREGGEVGKLKMEGRKVTKWGEDFFLLLLLLLFFLFCFSLFKITEICFGSTKIFCREKIRKNDFAPSEYSSYGSGFEKV